MDTKNVNTTALAGKLLGAMMHLSVRPIEKTLNKGIYGANVDEICILSEGDVSLYVSRFVDDPKSLIGCVVHGIMDYKGFIISVAEIEYAISEGFKGISRSGKVPLETVLVAGNGAFINPATQQSFINWVGLGIKEEMDDIDEYIKRQSNKNN